MDEIRKIDVLLIAPGPTHAQRILDKLGPDEMLVTISEMRKMSKVSVDERMAILEEVNDLVETLGTGSPAGDSPDSSHSSPPTPPDSAAAILDQVKDDLPPKIWPERLGEGGVDWSAAGFDFGSRGGSDDDNYEDPPSPRDRAR